MLSVLEATMRPSSSESGDPEELEARLGIVFGNKKLLRAAFVHSSYVHEHPEEELESNERLEFLGDAVLSLVVTELLYNRGRGLSEGQLTRARASLVSTPALAARARALGLGAYLCLGRGEEVAGGRDKPSLLEDAMEALIGAAYLDGGLRKARKLVKNLLGDLIEEALQGGWRRDWKSEVQEWAQKQGLEPRYESRRAGGPDHAPFFETALYLGGVLWGKGRGKSKKEAEQEAAKEALLKLTGGGTRK